MATKGVNTYHLHDMPLLEKFKSLANFILALLVVFVPSQGKELNLVPTTTILSLRNDVEIPRRGTEGMESIGLNDRWNDKDLITFFNGVPVWSQFSESLMPGGFSNHHIRQWLEESRRLLIKEVRPAVCGRNALVILEDGRRCCSRVKSNINLIMGDAYSFALSRLLDMHYVPSTILTDLRSKQWQNISSSNGSEKFSLAVLTEWVSDLSEAYVPQLLTNPGMQLKPDKRLANLSKEEIRDLIQWTDMLIFDYLTVNTDRMLNLLYNKQWNEWIMEHPVHNTYRRKDGLLVLLDNESGFIIGQKYVETGKAHSLHQHLLTGTCIFRQRTVEIIGQLSRSQDVGERLNTMLKHLDPLAKKLGLLSRKYTDGLQQRIDKVYQYMKSCGHNEN